MTKQLFLIRHAEAEASNFDIKDIDRPLTVDGEVIASKVGKLLKDLVGTPDVVLSSTALRTRQTAGLLMERMGFDIDNVEFKEELYEASTRILLREVNELKEDADIAMVIAHNPAVPYLAEYITGDVVGAVSPCGVVQISFDGTWSEITEKGASLIENHIPPTA